MKKTLLVLTLLVGLLFGLAGCDKTPEENENDDPSNGQDEIVLDQTLDAKFNGLLKDKKIYLTSAGQADLPIVENILSGAGLVVDEDYTSDNLLKASTVEDGAAVIIVLGASGKGLGAAGTNVNEEVARVKDFGLKAKDGKITVIVVHIGRAERTGAQSDPIIKEAIPIAKVALVVDTETANDVFDNAAKDQEVELMYFSKSTALIPPIKALFAK